MKRIVDLPAGLRRNALAAALVLALPAFAASSPNLPAERQQGAIAFRSGGVGQDEARAMEAAARRYPLELEFVKRQAGAEEFLAGVDVSIRDRKGKEVLRTTTDGPFLLARLPAGRYTVVAENDMAKRARRIAVPAHGSTRVLINW